jgi:hypothetical protein
MIAMTKIRSAGQSEAHGVSSTSTRRAGRAPRREMFQAPHAACIPHLTNMILDAPDQLASRRRRPHEFDQRRRQQHNR